MARKTHKSYICNNLASFEWLNQHESKSLFVPERHSLTTLMHHVWASICSLSEHFSIYWLHNALIWLPVLTRTKWWWHSHMGHTELAERSVAIRQVCWPFFTALECCNFIAMHYYLTTNKLFIVFFLTCSKLNTNS